MIPIHDYECTKCLRLVESIGGPPDEPCDCDSEATWRLVFRHAPQIRTEHASTVKHVMDMNARRMSEIEEEDAANNSEYSKEIAELAHHTPHAYEE